MEVVFFIMAAIVNPYLTKPLCSQWPFLFRTNSCPFVANISLCSLIDMWLFCNFRHRRV